MMDHFSGRKTGERKKTLLFLHLAKKMSVTENLCLVTITQKVVIHEE